MARTSQPDPVLAYAEDVIAGRVVAGRLVRLACERHVRDLVDGPARGLTWDPAAALKAIGFFAFLRHSKGEWAGKPLVLSPWQQLIIGSLWGWKREDGKRRFRMSYGEIPRKGGKSTLAAGVGLLLAFFDAEGGAEVYTAATKRDQARIVHGEAVRMVKASPELKKRIEVYKDNLSREETNSKYAPLGKDADSTDGLNPNGVIVDELHAHKTRELLDVLETATGARGQPLIFIITTAGVAGRPTVCSEMHDYAERVLTGQVEDDTLFAYVAGIDPGDSWQDEASWWKANPNLGVSCKLDDLRRKCAKAKEMPSAQATFRQKHLNEWVQSLEVWLPDDRWMAPGNVRAVEAAAALAGEECYGGLDLANTLDMSAFALVFPRGESRAIPRLRPRGEEVVEEEDVVLTVADSYDVLLWFWVPEQRVAERQRINRVHYRPWIEAGLIEQTEGESTDYDVIRERIRGIRELYDVREIAVDPHEATQLCNQLQMDGVKVFRFGQNMASYNGPMTMLEKLTREGRIRHGGNPVLRWMVGNVVAVRNGLGQVMPSRKKSADKIDGVVAVLQALARAMLRQPGGSVYDTRGVLSLDTRGGSAAPAQELRTDLWADDPDDD